MVKSVSVAKPRKAITATLQVVVPGGVPTTEQERKFVEAVQAEETVDVLVPLPFTLTLDNHLEVSVAAGVQPMPKSWLEHWYVRQRGVVPFKG